MKKTGVFHGERHTKKTSGGNGNFDRNESRNLACVRDLRRYAGHRIYVALRRRIYAVPDRTGRMAADVQLYVSPFRRGSSDQQYADVGIDGNAAGVCNGKYSVRIALYPFRSVRELSFSVSGGSDGRVCRFGRRIRGCIRNRRCIDRMGALA